MRAGLALSEQLHIYSVIKFCGFSEYTFLLKVCLFEENILLQRKLTDNNVVCQGSVYVQRAE